MLKERARRVRQFIVRQDKRHPELDEVKLSITRLSREDVAAIAAIAAIAAELRRSRGVRNVREETS